MKGVGGGGGGVHKQEKKIVQNQNVRKTESFIANEAEKRFSRLEKKSCTPAGCEKNNKPFQKVLPFVMVHS